jgi:hypothetical protein
MLSILNCLIFLKITFTALVEQEEPEQAEKLFRYSVQTKRSFCIEKLVGLNLPKENIRGFEPDPNASKEPIKQGQGRQQRDSTHENQNRHYKPKRNSFGPRRPSQNNDRRSNR